MSYRVVIYNLPRLRNYRNKDILTHIIHKIIGKLKQNKAGQSIHADFFCRPDSLFLRRPGGFAEAKA